MKKIIFFSITLVFSCLLVQAQNIDVTHYNYHLRLNDKNDTIYGEAKITFTISGTKGQAEFDLAGIDPKGKGMIVTQASFILPVPFTTKFLHQNNKLSLFGIPGKKGDTMTACIKYKGIPADGLIISKNKFGDRTFFADNWPDRAHHWIPCVDRPNDKASFEFTVTAPSQYKVISNGQKLAEKMIGDGFTSTHWKEQTPLPTKVMVIGVAKFATQTYPDSPTDIPVSAWIYPQDSTKGFHDYAAAPSILKFFADYIAPYPYKKLANVQSKTIFGGMENASAIFYAETSVNGKAEVEDLLAHEIVHQWFGDMASEKSFTHLWLSEGFATYLTNIYLEKKYGKDTLAKRMEEDRNQVISFVKNNPVPVVDSTTPFMQLLNANSYQKGGWILHMLRREVGDKNFQKIIQAYYNQYKGTNADSRDFEAVAEKVSGKELTWFFDQWLYRPGIPVLKMETKIQDNEFTLFVKQQGKPFHFNLPIEIIAEDGEIIRETFEVKEKESAFKARVKGHSLRFAIDPDVTLLYELKD